MLFGTNSGSVAFYTPTTNPFGTTIQITKTDTGYFWILLLLLFQIIILSRWLCYIKLGKYAFFGDYNNGRN